MGARKVFFAKTFSAVHDLRHIIKVESIWFHGKQPTRQKAQQGNFPSSLGWNLLTGCYSTNIKEYFWLGMCSRHKQSSLLKCWWFQCHYSLTVRWKNLRNSPLVETFPNTWGSANSYAAVDCLQKIQTLCPQYMDCDIFNKDQTWLFNRNVSK